MKNFQKGFTWLPVLLVFLGLIVVSGGAYYVGRQNPAPQTQVQPQPTPTSPAKTTTDTPTKQPVVKSPQANTSPSIKIDATSLVTSSITPTITGTATGITQVHFEAFDESGSRVAAAQATFDKVTGLWSFPINHSTEIYEPDGTTQRELRRGTTYSIEVFAGLGDPTVLTNGTLKITP